MKTVEPGGCQSDTARAAAITTRTHGGWRLPAWAVGWIVLALLLSTIPYVAGVLNAPPGSTFTGSLLNSIDTFSYYGKMQLGRHGEWGFNLFYTAEVGVEHGPFFMLHIALGHLARLTGLSIPLVYHVVRIVCGALLGVAVTQLAARTLAREAERRLALALVLFTGGWGWLVVILFGLSVNGDWFIDLWRYESSGPGTLAGFPHFALVVACQIWLVLAGLVVLKNTGRRSVWAAGFAGVFAAFGVVLVHPHQLLVPGVVLSVTTLRDVLIETETWRGSAAFKALLKRGVLLAVIFLPAALFVLAQWIAIQREPQIQAWLGNGSPARLWITGIGALYGPIWLLVVLGVWRVLRQRDVMLYPVVTWLVLELILTQLPFDFSSRYCVGLYVPVAILAAAGWNRCVAPWLSRHAPRRVSRAALPVLFSSVALSAVFLLVMLLVRVEMQYDPDYYMPADDRAALAWLDDVADLDDVVLSEDHVGNRIPAWAGVRVLVGHSSETLDYDQRADEVRWFFDAETADSARIDYLRRYGIDYVYVSPAERELGAFDAASAVYLAPDFTRGTVTIYVVQLPPE